MTVGDQDPFNDGDPMHEHWVKHAGLVRELEAYAQQYSEDYADGLDDGCIAEIGSRDLGGALVTTMRFEAERIGGEDVVGEVNGQIISVPGDTVMAKYTLTGEIRQSGLKYETFPKPIRKRIKKWGKYGNDFLRDQETEFAIVYTHSYVVATDGTFQPEDNLKICIDDDEFYINDSDLLGVEAKALASVAHSEEADTTGGDMGELKDILGEDEWLALNGLGDQIAKGFYNKAALTLFLNAMAAIEYKSNLERMDMVGNMAAQIFLVPQS